MRERTEQKLKKKEEAISAAEMEKATVNHKLNPKNGKKLEK